MPKKQPTVLPARFELNPDVLEQPGIVVKTLFFPYHQAVQQFRREAEEIINRDATTRKTKKEYVTPDFRQLNNALLACLTTLTHAFEAYGFSDDEEQAPLRRALAVGTPHAPLQTPTIEQINELLQLWANDWVMRTQTKDPSRSGEIEKAGRRLREAMSHPPADWGWVEVPIGPLLHDTTENKAIGYTALPAVLATLLHGRTCTLVTSKEKEIAVVWRKAQGARGNRTGLFVVSQPFQGDYVDDEGNLQKGYFAYRLDFNIETQAGRYREYKGEQKLQPWVFLFLTCQRYGHEPLVEGNYGRSVSFLVGIKEARLKGYPFDNTLVRLSAENVGTQEAPNYQWQHHLPDYLSSFQAKELSSPNDLIQKPWGYANWNNDPCWADNEYLLVNAHGYKYATEEGKAEHGVQTGYSLRERADVIGAVLDLLGGALLPDQAFVQDQPAPSGSKTPAAMRTHYFFRKESKGATAALRGREGVEKGIAAATRAGVLYLSLLYREADTRDAMRHFIHEALFLAPQEPFPAWLRVTEQLLDSDHLQVLPKPQAGSRDTDALAWDNKFEQWREVVEASRQAAPEPHLVFAEIGKVRQRGISPQQNIRGAARSACVRSHAASQFVQTAQRRKTPKSGEGAFSDVTENRTRSAVLDLLLRQTGALMGSPAEIHQAAGISVEIASQLDVIGFVRRRCNRDYKRGDVQYALAVRLRADGTVDVMLPSQSEWLPYIKAGHKIGRQFFRARNDIFAANGVRLDSPIKLTGGQLAEFVRRVLTGVGNQPTLAIIEAPGWRNGGGRETEGKVWPQLTNPRMLNSHQQLDFSHLEAGKVYERDNKDSAGLLAVIRLRTGDEVPHYVPNLATWQSEDDVRGLQHLSGFCDWSARPLLHYFSAGRSPLTAKVQDNIEVRKLFKLEKSESRVWGIKGEPYALRIPYKHPAMVEMVPFFVRPDFDHEAGLTALCRIPHYLRFSPAWAMGNLDSPYPLHLGDTLIADQLCVLGLEGD